MDYPNLVPFGYSTVYNKLVSVDEVPNMLKNSCICFSCKMHLITKKGETNVHHFAHKVKADIPCIYSPWVSIRDMAKQIIRENDYLKLNKFLLKSHQSLPYDSSFSYIEIKSCKEPQGCDFLLETSIGKIALYLSTPEHDIPHHSELSFNVLHIAINLSPFENKSFSSSYGNLDNFIIYSNNSKIILSNEFKRLKRKNINSALQSACEELDIPEECLDKDAYQIFEDIKPFYDRCNIKYRNLLSEEYQKLELKGYLSYIAYKYKGYCTIHLNNVYTIYRFNKNTFIKVGQTNDLNDVPYQINKYININNPIPLYKRTTIQDIRLLSSLGIQEEELSRDDIKSINLMKNFHARATSSYKGTLQDELSIIEEQPKHILIGYKMELYSIAKFMDKFCVYNVIADEVIPLGKVNSMKNIPRAIDIYIYESLNSF